jgi:hypothetical protein
MSWKLSSHLVLCMNVFDEPPASVVDFCFFVCFFSVLMQHALFFNIEHGL